MEKSQFGIVYNDFVVLTTLHVILSGLNTNFAHFVASNTCFEESVFFFIFKSGKTCLSQRKIRDTFHKWARFQCHRNCVFHLFINENKRVSKPKMLRWYIYNSLHCDYVYLPKMYTTILNNKRYHNYNLLNSSSFQLCTINLIFLYISLFIDFFILSKLLNFSTFWEWRMLWNSARIFMSEKYCWSKNAQCIYIVYKTM